MRNVDTKESIILGEKLKLDMSKKVKHLSPGQQKKLQMIIAMTGDSDLYILDEPTAGLDPNATFEMKDIVKDVFFNREVFNALESSKLSKKKLEIMKDIRKESVSAKDLQLISTSIRKYTSGYQNKKGTQAPLGKMIKGLLTSPDYKMKDFKAMMINGYQKNQSLWKEILSLDLSQLLQEVQIPYIILQGDTDIVASTKTVSELVEKSNNENLQCEVIENSGHMPGSEGMDRVFEKLCLFC